MTKSEDVFAQKRALRKHIAELKEGYTGEELRVYSEQIMNNLEQLNSFRQAKTVFIYHSMPQEVHTHDLIRKYSGDKAFLLPVVTKSGLILRKYNSDNELQISDFGISEPTGPEFTDYEKIDLIVVPGVAFDRNLNRMGYGKGYYDGILQKTDAQRVAVCFDFQLLKCVPHTHFDVKMNLIVCQTGIIS